MPGFLVKLPEEIFLLCLNPILSTSAAELSLEQDHVCYKIQPSLCAVNKTFHHRLRPIFKAAKFVQVHFGGSEELSPERFIPVVSTSAIRLNNLSWTDRKLVFLADISVCAQARDGQSASQDIRSSSAVVSLDALSLWLAILASKQYAFREAKPLLLTVFCHSWSEGDDSMPGREDFLRALSLLDRKCTKLWLRFKGHKSDRDRQLDEDKDVWCLQHPHAQLEAVLLWRSWLGRVLRHGRVLTALKNESALQIMCADVMRHTLTLRSSDRPSELHRHLAQVLCSLLLTWASHYHHQRYMLARDIFTEETKWQQDIKVQEAQCDYASCPCVLFHILGLPEADTLTPSLKALQEYGIDEPAWLELCLTSLSMHHVRYPSDHPDPTSARRTCCAGLQRLTSMCERNESRLLLDKDIRVLSVASNEGLEALSDYPDLPLAVPIDENEDPDLIDAFQVFNRLSVSAEASEACIWETDEDGIRRIPLEPIDNPDMFESDLLHLPLLRKFRRGNLVSPMM